MAKINYEEQEHCKQLVLPLAAMRRKGLLCYAHNFNGNGVGARLMGILKAMGLLPGIPDYTVYLKGGRAFFIEVKVKGNYLTKTQKKIIPELEGLGYTVYVVTSKTKMEARKTVREIIKNEVNQYVKD